ncbi:MAG: alpha/beta hydrolase [Gammaproteobacteria bacterium]
MKALCGEVEVALNPADPSGKTITLFVAKVPALARSAEASAFTLIAGGPGQASTEAYTSLRGAFERVRRERDIILVDQRGTGRSSIQQCDTDEVDSIEVEFDAAVIREATETCLAKLGDDVKFYTTSAAVSDLDTVREAFGYEQLDIYGVSYGTRVAQHYLRRYPDRTRTVILDGVVPVNVPLGPGIALDAQRALDLIFTRCVSQSDCHLAFGDISEKFNELLNRTREAPIELILDDPISAEKVPATFGYGELLMAVRMMSYSPETAALLPFMIDEAIKENYQPLAAQALLNSENLTDMLALGMHNSVACTEDVPFYDHDAIDSDRLAASYMGDLAYKGLIETCKIWPRGPIDDDFTQPFASAAPVLVLSGEVDPVTPPANGDLAAGYLELAKSVTLPGQGHGQIQIGCMPKLLADFVRTANLDELEIECLDIQQPAPFFVSPSGPKP